MCAREYEAKIKKKGKKEGKKKVTLSSIRYNVLLTN